ncbi:uncharacterized protein TNCV_3857911 [Trichonephila clavipes]|nr:uncharacterized protein TNCV_3857911 [Trichonephila clavipes]
MLKITRYDAKALALHYGSGMETYRLERRESRFNLSSDDNHVPVWRLRGERLNPAFALQRHTAPTAGVMEPFFNKTMFVLTRKGCHKTVSTLLLPFLGLLDSQICLQLSISGIIWDGELGIPKFERTRGKVTSNMERNVSRHHTKLVCINARSYRIEHSH